MSYKRFVYESEIVQEYWYVNLNDQTVKQYENIDNELHLKRTLKMGDTVKSTVIEGFEMRLEDMFNVE
jgi:Uma2 family endonuclease